MGFLGYALERRGGRVHLLRPKPLPFSRFSMGFPEDALERRKGRVHLLRDKPSPFSRCYMASTRTCQGFKALHTADRLHSAPARSQ